MVNLYHYTSVQNLESILTHAVLLSKLSKKEQDDFLDYILSNKLNINDAKDAMNK